MKLATLCLCFIRFNHWAYLAIYSYDVKLGKVYKISFCVASLFTSWPSRRLPPVCHLWLLSPLGLPESTLKHTPVYLSFSVCSIWLHALLPLLCISPNFLFFSLVSLIISFHSLFIHPSSLVLFCHLLIPFPLPGWSPSSGHSYEVQHCSRQCFSTHQLPYHSGSFFQAPLARDHHCPTLLAPCRTPQQHVVYIHSY